MALIIKIFDVLGKAVGGAGRAAGKVIFVSDLHKWLATSYACQIIINWMERRFHFFQPEQIIEVQSPHPNWNPTQRQPIPYDGQHTALDPTVLGASACYPLVISAIVPRPIALISTLSATGDLNLAPFSYFGAMGHDPPMVSVGICRSSDRGGGMKDTCQNIVDTKEFVVNIISSWFIEAANHTCGNFATGVNELALANLTEMRSLKVKPPRVAESAVHLECELVHQYDVKNSSGVDTTTIFIGQVVMFHVHEGVQGRSPSGKVVVDPKKLFPMSRLGGNTCAALPTHAM